MIVTVVRPRRAPRAGRRPVTIGGRRTRSVSLRVACMASLVESTSATVKWNTPSWRASPLICPAGESVRPFGRCATGDSPVRRGGREIGDQPGGVVTLERGRRQGGGRDTHRWRDCKRVRGRQAGRGAGDHPERSGGVRGVDVDAAELIGHVQVPRVVDVQPSGVAQLRLTSGDRECRGDVPERRSGREGAHRLTEGVRGEQAPGGIECDRDRIVERRGETSVDADRDRVTGRPSGVLGEQVGAGARRPDVAGRVDHDTHRLTQLGVEPGDRLHGLCVPLGACRVDGDRVVPFVGDVQQTRVVERDSGGHREPRVGTRDRPHRRDIAACPRREDRDRRGAGVRHVDRAGLVDCDPTEAVQAGRRTADRG